MHEKLENFYLKQEEPNQSCFLALRDIITAYHNEITVALKYGLPFFMFRGKMFCYLWKDKKTNQPYVSFSRGSKLDHPALFQGDRKLVKLLYVDPNKDIPIDTLSEILEEAVALY